MAFDAFNNAPETEPFPELLLVLHQRNVRGAVDRGRVAAGPFALPLEHADLPCELLRRGAERRVPSVRDPGSARTGRRSRPPHTLPPANADNAAIERAAEMPGAPPAAKPRKTTFPVMFAVKMWPSPRKLIASTRPVTTVKPMSARTRGV